MGSTPDEHRPSATDEEGGDRHGRRPADDPADDGSPTVREQRAATYSGISEILVSVPVVDGEPAVDTSDDDE